MKALYLERSILEPVAVKMDPCLVPEVVIIEYSESVFFLLRHGQKNGQEPRRATITWLFISLKICDSMTRSVIYDFRISCAVFFLHLCFQWDQLNWKPFCPNYLPFILNK